MKTNLEIRAEQEVVSNFGLMSMGIGVRIPSAGKDKPFYFVEDDGIFQTYVRKNGERAEYITINKERSRMLRELVGPGNSLEIFEADPKKVDDYFRKLESLKEDGSTEIIDDVKVEILN